MYSFLQLYHISYLIHTNLNFKTQVSLIFNLGHQLAKDLLNKKLYRVTGNSSVNPVHYICSCACNKTLSN